MVKAPLPQGLGSGDGRAVSRVRDDREFYILHGHSVSLLEFLRIRLSIFRVNDNPRCGPENPGAVGLKIPTTVGLSSVIASPFLSGWDGIFYRYVTVILSFDEG